MPGRAVVIQVQAEDQATPVFDRIKGAISDIGQIAAGVAIGNWISQIGEQIGDLIAFLPDLLGIAGSYDMANRSIQALLASQELLNSQQWEEVVVGQQVVGLTKKEREELEKLTDKIDLQIAKRNRFAAQLQEQRQRVIEMTSKWTEEGLATETARRRLVEMELQLQEMDEDIAAAQARIAELTAKEGAMVPVIDRVLKGQISWSEAMQRSAPEAAKLIKIIRDVSIQMGVPLPETAAAFRFAAVTGMSNEQLQTIMPNLIRFGRILGIDQIRLKNAAKALADVQARGKLTGEEIRQLANASIPIMSLLAAQTGKTREEITKLVKQGAIPAEQVMGAVAPFLETVASGAEDMSETLPIASAGLKEAAKVDLAALFGPAAAGIGEFLAGIRDLLGGEETLQKLAEAGAKIRGWVSGLLADLSNLVNFVRFTLIPAFTAGGLQGALIALGEHLGLRGQDLANFANAVDNVREAILDWWADLKATILPILQWLGKQIGLLTGKGSLFASVIDLLANRFNTANPYIRAFLDLLALLVTGGILAGIISLILALAPVVIIAAKAFLLLAAVWAILAGFETGFWARLKDAIVGTFQAAVEWVKNAILHLQAFGSILEGIGRILGGIATGNFREMIAGAEQVKESWAAFQEMSTRRLQEELKSAAQGSADFGTQVDLTKQKVEGLPERIPALDGWFGQFDDLLKKVGDLQREMGKLPSSVPTPLPAPPPAPGAPAEPTIMPLAAMPTPGAAARPAPVQQIQIQVRVNGMRNAGEVREAAYQGALEALRALASAI